MLVVKPTILFALTKFCSRKHASFDRHKLLIYIGVIYLVGLIHFEGQLMSLAFRLCLIGGVDLRE